MLPVLERCGSALVARRVAAGLPSFATACSHRATLYVAGRKYSTASEHVSRRVTKLVSSENYSKHHVKAEILPSDQLIEEENLPGFDPEEWANIAPGDIFNGRYQAISKIGWGSVSTVWLAKDLNRRDNSHHHGYYTLKVSKSETYDRKETVHEMAVMKRLHDANPKHKGFKYIRTFDDYFEVEIQGQPNTSVVLVQEPMRETLGQFRRRFKGNKLPLKILQGFMQYWLAALDYMHSEAKIVHTDIKEANILMTFESAEVLTEYDATQKTHPMAMKLLRHNRALYKSHPTFGPLKSFATEPRLVDFGAAHRMDGVPYKLFPIQPRYYRAPEVILGCGWSYAADIWNLGVLLFTLLEDHHLFRRVNTEEGTYDVRSHVAQMYKLLGPLPKKMVERVKGTAKQKFEPPMVNDGGVECDTPQDYFGGPFFDENGEFRHKDIVPQDLSWEGKVRALEGEDRELFLKFVKRMLTWDPEERATAGELLSDPWVIQHNKVV